MIVGLSSFAYKALSRKKKDVTTNYYVISLALAKELKKKKKHLV